MHLENLDPLSHLAGATSFPGLVSCNVRTQIHIPFTRYPSHGLSSTFAGMTCRFTLVRPCPECAAENPLLCTHPNNERKFGKFICEICRANGIPDADNQAAIYALDRNNPSRATDLHIKEEHSDYVKDVEKRTGPKVRPPASVLTILRNSLCSLRCVCSLKMPR